MTTLIGLAGSLRHDSYNAALLRAAVAVAPSSVTLDVADIRGIPLYDGDLEQERGVPEPVTALKERIAACDGLLLVTPEYNGSIPGTFKNAIDWLTRPPKDVRRVFGGKPVGLIGATPGTVGTRLAQTAWLPVFRALGMRPFFGAQLYVAGAGRVFDDAGTLADDAVRERLTAYVSAFAQFAGA